MIECAPQLGKPLSAQELATCREREAAQNRRRVISQTVLLWTCPAVGIVLLIAALFTSSQVGVAGCFFLVVGWLIGLLFADGIESESNHYAPLSEHQCAEMLALCQEVKGGMDWRDAVLTEAREFTVADLEAMREVKARQAEWLAREPARRACRALYGIGEPPVTGGQQPAT